MVYEPISKNTTDRAKRPPNLSSYEAGRKNFDWKNMAQPLDGLESGGLNIAHEVIDRHIKTPLKDKIALYWEGSNGETETYSFLDLYHSTNRFANGLKELGIQMRRLLKARALGLPEGDTSTLEE